MLMRTPPSESLEPFIAFLAQAETAQKKTKLYKGGANIACARVNFTRANAEDESGTENEISPPL